MGVGEISAPLCQRIHVRCHRFRVASEEAGPVIQVVDADHQDIGPGHLGVSLPAEEKGKGGDCDGLNGSDGSSVIHVDFFRGESLSLPPSLAALLQSRGTVDGFISKVSP